MKLTIVIPSHVSETYAALVLSAKRNLRTVENEVVAIIREHLTTCASSTASTGKAINIEQSQPADNRSACESVADNVEVDDSGTVNSDGSFTLPRRVRFGATPLRGRKSTTYRGVSRYGKRWQARTTENGKYIRLGTFNAPEDAALCWDAYARAAGIEEHGLNFPNYVDNTTTNMPPLPVPGETSESYRQRLVDFGYPAPRIDGVINAAFPPDAVMPQPPVGVRRAVDEDDIESVWED